MTNIKTQNPNESVNDKSLIYLDLTDSFGFCHLDFINDSFRFCHLDFGFDIQRRDCNGVLVIN